jgi:hypothetical protein
MDVIMPKLEMSGSISARRRRITAHAGNGQNKTDTDRCGHEAERRGKKDMGRL